MLKGIQTIITELRLALAISAARIAALFYSDANQDGVAVSLSPICGNVNCGGALAAASELYDEDNVAAACVAAFDKTTQLLETARDGTCPPWQVLKRAVRGKIFGSTHPVVEQERGYLFIGDQTSPCSNLARVRWLRSIVDRDADAFPAFGVAHIPTTDDEGRGHA
jgi:hypothetical protein